MLGPLGSRITSKVKALFPSVAFKRLGGEPNTHNLGRALGARTSGGDLPERREWGA